MKTKIFLLFLSLISVGVFFTVCSKEENNYLLSFKQTFLRYFNEDKIFLVKGIALDIYEYGRTIEVIEDLKGNFEDKSSIFVWGDISASLSDTNYVAMAIDPSRLDFITLYNDNDTLIMFLEKAHKRFDMDIENDGDYGTLYGARSILKFSNGYVTGYINTWGGKKEETILWEKLLNELHKLLNSK